MDELDRQRMIASQREYEEIEKRKLILEIRAWVSAFKKYVGEIVGVIDLEKQDYASLKSLLEQIKFTVATRTTGMVSEKIAQKGLPMLELLGGAMGWRLSGPKRSLTNMAIEDENFADLIKETTLDHAHWVYTKPLNRLLLYLSMTASAVHMENTMADSLEEKKSEDVADVLEQARKLREDSQK